MVALDASAEVNMSQTILFATDLGVHTSYLLHHVNALAAERSARVIVLHVIEPPGQLGDAVVKAYLSDECQHELEQSGIERIIDGVKDRIVTVLEDEFLDGNPGLAGVRDVRVVTGKPVEVILEQANKSGADLLVLGSHSHENQNPHMLGSVTARVLQMSRIPVFMVPLTRHSHLTAGIA